MRTRRHMAWSVALVLGVLGPSGFVGAAEPAAPAGRAVLLVRATGKAAPPKRVSGARARILAERGATVIALRNLAAKLGGAPTDVKTGTIKVDAFLAGHRLADRRYEYDKDGRLKAVEVVVEMDLHKLYGNVQAVLRDQLAEARGKNAEVRTKLDVAQADAARLADENRSLRDAVTKLQADTRKKDDQLAQAAARQKTLATALADQKQRHKDLAAQVERLKKEIATLKADIERLRSQE